MRETDLFPPMIKRFRDSRFEVKQEVRVPRLGRSVDLVADNQEIIIAVEGKLRLNTEVIDQAKELRAICDMVYVVAAKIPDHSPLVGDCALYGIGIMQSIGESTHQILEADIFKMGDPSILRAAFDAATGDSVKAGSPTGSCNSVETEYFNRLVKAVKSGSFYTRQLMRIVPRSPFGQSRATLNAIKRKINDGALPLVIENDEIKLA